MHRIDGDAPAIALPTPAAVGATVGYFTEGDAGTGVEATEVTADWLNAVQEEISYVIEQAGGVLDKTSRTQLKLAIDSMVGAPSGNQSNLGFTAAVAANALTFSLKTKAGAAPSSSDPVRISFRNSTLTTGQYAVRSVTSALTLVISSGSTLGNGSAVSEWIYLYALDNAGAVELAASTTLFPDNTIQTTTAEGGAGAADSRVVLYSTTARSNVVVRLIGRIKSSQAAAGTWASSPTELSMAPFSDLRKSASQLTNVGLAASVGSSALTISLKDALGNDPSSSGACKIGFRSSTLTSGTFREIAVLAALSVVVSSGSTLGHSSATNEWIYVYALDATDLGGGVELAVSSTLFADGSIQSSTAEGGAGAADSRTVLYSTTARASVPIRLIGRMKSNQAAAGTYASAVTEISLAPLVLARAVPSIQRLTSTGSTTGWVFTISTSSTVAVGDTYTNNGNTYTVLAALTAQTGQVLFTSGVSAPTGTGTLTRSAGAGTASITFTQAFALATYTAPSPAPLYLKVKMVGAGGGGAGTGTTASSVCDGAVGGNTLFGLNLLVANGGGQGKWANPPADGGTATVNSPAISIVAAKGGHGGGDTGLTTTSTAGGNGGVSPFGGSGYGSFNIAGAAGQANSGSGGGGAGTIGGANTYTGSGGSAGGYLEAILNVDALGSSFVYCVGIGGTAGPAATGFAGGTGGSGIIIVEEHYQ